MKSEFTPQLDEIKAMARQDVAAVRAGQNYMLHWLEQQYPTRTVNRTSPSPSAGERGGWMGRVER